MLSRLFPKRIDNDYRGYWLAVWLLLILLLGRASASINALGWNPSWTSADILRNIYRIPLDTFTANAAETAVWLFARWGGTHLMLTALGFIALIRYRAMIPLLYVLVTLDQIVAKALADAAPIVKGGGSGVPLPLPVIAIAVSLIGLAMSLTMPRRHEHET
jgi:hypothetical protein